MIKYVIRAKRNISTQAVNYHPVVAPVTPIGIETVSQSISGKCTVTRSDVQAVLLSLEEYIVEQVKCGNSIRLGSLGSFRPTFSTKGQEDKDQVSAADILRVRLRFHPSAWLSRQLDKRNCQFTQGKAL